MSKTNKINWKNVANKSWYYTKLILGLCLICSISFGFGTFYPNQLAIKNAKKEVEIFYVNKVIQMNLEAPEFSYSNDIQFVRAMHKCIDYINFTLHKDKRVPYEMIIAQAALETGWGTSRFSLEGNNLFGIRTWKKEVPHMIPIGVKSWPGWGVKKFKSKCDSVKEYIRILNEHTAYKEFREVRKSMLVNNRPLDPIILIQKIDNFSTTSDYDERVIKIIKKIRKLESLYASDKNVNK